MTQAATVQKLVGDFGASAKAKLQGGGQPEDQLRTPLENLLHALAEVAVISMITRFELEN